MSTLFQVSMALLSAALAAWFAVITYFRQREHELILSRYLDGGLDLLAAEVQRVSETFSHNWARCLAILKSFRDMGTEFNTAELSQGFIELQSSKHNIVAHHRLLTLTGAAEYWHFYQKAMAYYTSANSVLVKEIPEVLRAKLTSDSLEENSEEIAEKGFVVAKEQDDRSHKFVLLVAELQTLSAALECERYTFKSLKKFKRKSEVKESIERIKSMLASLPSSEAEQGNAGDAQDARA